jgi:hypothetical protein
MKPTAIASKDHQVQPVRRAPTVRAIVTAAAVAAAAAGCTTQVPAAAPPPPSTPAAAPSPPSTVAAAPSPPSAAAVAPKASYPSMAPVEQYLIADRDAEIALARSAAPAKISDDATVYVLARRGYEKVVDGKNGFVCFVDRSWQSDFDDPEFWNPNERSPTCMNAPAARSVLPTELRRTDLALAGLGREQILERVKDAIAKKELAQPEIGAMSYMMSKQQHINGRIAHWHPHLMFYMPGDMNPSAWGANLPSGTAVYGGGEDLPGGGRMPWTIFFVPVPMWSDGTVAEVSAHH